MPTDAEALKWVEVNDFSPGIYDPRGTVLNSAGPGQLGQASAPLGSAQLFHAIDSFASAIDLGIWDDASDNKFQALVPDPGSSQATVAGIVPGNDAQSFTRVGSSGYLASGDLTGTIVRGLNSGPNSSGNVWGCAWVSGLITGTTLTLFQCETDQFPISPYLQFALSPTSFNHWQLTAQRYTISGFDSAVSNAFLISPTTDPHFFSFSWDILTGNVTFYMDGAPVSGISPGHFNPPAAPNPISVKIGEGPALATPLVIDEVAFGPGAPGDAEWAFLYSQGLISFEAWADNILVFGAFAFYHLGEAIIPAIPHTPGTYRCVSAPGKGLIGAPRKLTDAQLNQGWPLVSAKELSGLPIGLDGNVLVDASGKNHHGRYDPNQLLRVPGSFGDDAGVSSSVDNTSPFLPNQAPVGILTFQSSWTVNCWLKVAVSATQKNLIEVQSISTGSDVRIAYTNNGTLIVAFTRGPNGGAATTLTLTTTALSNAYHMVSLTYDESIDTAKLYVDGVLADTQVGVGTVPAIFGSDALLVTGCVSKLNDRYDNLSFHPDIWTAGNLLALHGASADYATYRTELFSHATSFDPDSFYPFNEDGTHAASEQRALITASHLVSPVLTAGAAIQPSPPVAPAYQDGLFVSFSWFVDPVALSTTDQWNQTDARLYKLWLNPTEIYDFRSGFTSAPEPFLVPTRLDGSPWSEPFWHGIGDFTEIVNSITADGQPPYTRQVIWLYNMVQSQAIPEPWAMLIVGYPNEATHTVDSIDAMGAAGLGTILLTPELVFSHEGRLCLIDGYDGDAFGTDVAGRGMNDIAYYAIRAAAFSAFQIFSLQRPIEENQSGIRVAQSVNANELFLVKATGGGAVISGDMDFPTIRRLPGLHSPGDIYAKPTNTPIGIVYAGRGGVYLWSGAESSQLLSEQFDGPFWSPYIGAWKDYTPPANRFGFHGGFDFLHPWILCPSHFLFDTRFQSWWLLDKPDEPYPAFFMHGTSQGHILAVYPEVNADSPVLANRYDPEQRAYDWCWTSQPITPENFRVAVVREINFQATARPRTDPDETGSQMDITVAGLNGDYQQSGLLLIQDGRPHTYRLTFAMETETFIITFNGFDDNLVEAPILHSFRVGYELAAEHPEATAGIFH